MAKKIATVLLIITFLIIYACESRKAAVVYNTDILNQRNEISETEDENNEEEIETPQSAPAAVEATRAELVMRAIKKGYPDRIAKVEFRDDDWAVFLTNAGADIASSDPAGKWYYYANGRLLPEEKKEEAANFRALQFYNYTAELPPWVERSPEERERMGSWAGSRRQNTTARSAFFLDDLFAAATRAEVERNLVRITFLGANIRVHKYIQEKVVIIEAQIRSAANADREIQTWITSLGTTESWNWRNIADSEAKSYHAYGLAIDLLPRNLGGKQTYWLWTSQHRDDWYNVPYSQRYHPPQAAITAFENHGFIWGGKWPLFDTMHFEYRPEVLVLNGFDYP